MLTIIEECMICPKCNHNREDTNDGLSEDECPNCGVFYSKYLKAQKIKSNGREKNEEIVRSGNKKKKIILIVAALSIAGVFEIYAIKSFFTESNNSNPQIEVVQANTKMSEPVIYNFVESKWYENGTLHKSSVADWKNATYKNRLATAADWALSQPQINDIVKKSRSIDTGKPFAEELVKCVNNAASGKGYGSMKVSELATSCMILMRW